MSAGFRFLGQVPDDGCYHVRFWTDDGVVHWRRQRRSKTREKWKTQYGLTRAAHRILRVGDRIRCHRCGGAKPTYTFVGWDDFWWAVSKSRDDLDPSSIDRVNGKPADFRAMRRQGA